MALKLINSSIFELKMSGPGKSTWLHLGTVLDGMKEYVCVTDTATNQCYVNIIIGSQLEAIEDDNEFNDVSNFFNDHGIADLKKVANYIGQRKVDSIGKGK